MNPTWLTPTSWLVLTFVWGSVAPEWIYSVSHGLCAPVHSTINYATNAQNYFSVLAADCQAGEISSSPDAQHSVS